MKHTAKRLARLIAFGLVLLLLITLGNVFFVRTDAVSVMTLREMYAREDIELAFIGSSIVREHVNPAILEEKTGMKTFDASFLSATLAADIAVATELFKGNDPKWTVLAVELSTLHTAKEKTETQFMIAPHIRDPRVTLKYYMDLCAQDGLYIDRALMWRTYYPRSMDELTKTLGMRFAPEKTFEKVSAESAERMTYMGAGFQRMKGGTSAEKTIRREIISTGEAFYTDALLPATQEQLLEFKALCEAEGTNLIVVCFPWHTANVLSRSDYLPYTGRLLEFCADNGIACYDLTRARPSLMPNLDAYYIDPYHMSGEGADIFSEALGDFLVRAMAGEELSGEFYASDAEYLASIDFITNTWIVPGEGDAYMADCSTGSLVVPEYRFELIGADGESTLVRDYDTGARIEVEIPDGMNLRVWARPQGGEQRSGVYYDYPADYAAFYGEE